MAFTITGFGPGEVLADLRFDSVPVLPLLPIAANGDGVVTGTFTIPPNVTAGTKTVTARVPLLASATAEYRKDWGCVLEKWDH